MNRKTWMVPSTVILIHGPPGSGKSHVALALANEDPRIRVFSNDVIRRELGLPTSGREFTASVYREVARRADHALSEGEVPVLDATYYLKTYRCQAFETLAHHAPHWVIVELRTPVARCRERIVVRKETGKSKVGGVDDEQHFDLLVSRTEPIDPSELPTNRSNVTIDGSGTKPLLLDWSARIPAEILALFRRICRECSK